MCDVGVLETDKPALDTKCRHRSVETIGCLPYSSLYFLDKNFSAISIFLFFDIPHSRISLLFI